MSVQVARLRGDRLHLQHGPIDLVIGVDGEREIAFEAAQARLGTVLAELMDEIDLLRSCRGSKPKDVIAQLMWRAAQAHDGFVTPMAGVAGAVAQTVMLAMQSAAKMRRAYVNNGGDIALHLDGDAQFSVGMSGLDGRGLGRVTLQAASPIRGIATSGQAGRSLSFGIADSVTVLATTASQADVAATLIAGAVDLPGHPAIKRAPACELSEGSDLGAREVVLSVSTLSDHERAHALERGAQVAHTMQGKGLISAASLHLQGESRQVEMQTEKVLEHA